MSIRPITTLAEVCCIRRLSLCRNEGIVVVSGVAGDQGWPGVQPGGWVEVADRGFFFSRPA